MPADSNSKELVAFRDPSAFSDPVPNVPAELGGRMGTHRELRRLLDLLASFPTSETADHRQLQVGGVY